MPCRLCLCVCVYVRVNVRVFSYVIGCLAACMLHAHIHMYNARILAYIDFICAYLHEYLAHVPTCIACMCSPFDTLYIRPITCKKELWVLVLKANVLVSCDECFIS